MTRNLYDPLPAASEETDSHQQTYDFGDGGVPWYLLLFYLSFLVFFTWYVLEYQLPDFAAQGPVSIEGIDGQAGVPPISD
ncbi:MAG: hypothetical protein ACI841_004545 [Planctomycetota bacterium]